MCFSFFCFHPARLMRKIFNFEMLSASEAKSLERNNLDGTWREKTASTQPRARIHNAATHFRPPSSVLPFLLPDPPLPLLLFPGKKALSLENAARSVARRYFNFLLHAQLCSPMLSLSLSLGYRARQNQHSEVW